MAKANNRSTAKDSTANFGFEAEIWLAAEKLRNKMDTAEYKHVVLGLIFLKYISATISLTAASEGEKTQRSIDLLDIRRALIEADLVDCMVALPGQLFYSTQIPVCLRFLAKNKAADAKRSFSDRQKRTRSIGSGKLAGIIHKSQRLNELN